MGFGEEIADKLRNIFGADRSPGDLEIGEAQESALVIEKFRLLAAAGSEGQEPIVSYHTGNTIILSDLPAGTILREKYTDYHSPDEDMYIFWYMGGSDRKTGGMKMYDAHHPRITYRLPYLENVPKLGCIRRVIPMGQKDKLEFEIGQPGVLVDLHLHTLKDQGLKRLSETRHTTQLDVLEFGQKVKQEQKSKVTQPLGRLVPVPQHN